MIIGDHVSALIKSYTDKIPIIMPSYIPPSIDLQYESDFNVAQLSTRSHTESWYMLKFLCAMEGLVINPDRLESVRVVEDQIYYRGNDLCFEKCHIFPGKEIKIDLDVKQYLDENKFKIIDFMRLKFCDASKLGCILLKSHKIFKIQSIGKKEIYAVSFLEKEDLTNFDYSDTMVRFIVEKTLLENKNLHRPLIRQDSDSRRIPKLEVVERRVIPLKETVYKSTKRTKYYDHKKRNDIIKAYCRHNTSIKS